MLGTIRKYMYTVSRLANIFVYACMYKHGEFFTYINHAVNDQINCYCNSYFSYSDNLSICIGIFCLRTDWKLWRLAHTSGVTCQFVLILSPEARFFYQMKFLLQNETDGEIWWECLPSQAGLIADATVWAICVKADAILSTLLSASFLLAFDYPRLDDMGALPYSGVSPHQVPLPALYIIFL